MQFHHWQTLLDEAGQIHGKEWKKKPHYDQMQSELLALLEHPFQNENIRSKRIIRLCMESEWIRSGRPYYNIHPVIAGKLGKTNLDKIPAQYVEVPGNFSSINIRFTNDVPIRLLPMGQPFHFGYGMDTPTGVRSVLFGKYDFRHDPLIKEFAPQMVGEDQYVLILDEGCRVIPEKGCSIQRMLCNMITLSVRPSETIPQAIERAAADVAGTIEEVMMRALRDQLDNLFRIIISVGFLANCPEDMLILPDVLADDRRKYWEALQAGYKDDAARIAAKAKRRGKLGWNVGTNEMFVGERPFGHRNHGSGYGTRELQWSHIRSGHPHAVRFGHGKTQVKIKWYAPTRVKPDKPFKAE